MQVRGVNHLVPIDAALANEYDVKYETVDVNDVLGSLDEARARLASIDQSLGGLGGDGRSRARELDLLGFQLEELDGAGLDDPDEDEVLAREESALADATARAARLVAALLEAAE